MPRLYKPPVIKRTQAVQTTKGRRRARVPQRWRRLWMVPLLGLVPVVVAVVLASEGGFGAPGRSPVASAPAATSTTAAAGLAAAPASNQAGQPVGSQPAAQSQAGAPQAATQAPAAQAPGGQNAVAQTVGPPVTGQTSADSAASNPASAANPGTGLFRAYLVKPGDTVKFVAGMYGVSPASVAQASGLRNPDQLRVGQVLTVPIEPGWLYRVQSGETLDQIAARTGVPSAVIQSASKLSSDLVLAGDVILIPDQSTARGK